MASLWSSSLISPEVTTSLPEGFQARPLERNDFSKGYLDCLRVLTHVEDFTEEQFHERYDELNAINMVKPTYYLLVIEHQGKIVGTGSLIVERKFIHNRGLCGHIEEVSVAKEYQGKKLGLQIIRIIDSVAEKVGCYKTILDCSPKNEPFYVKCGYFNSGAEMSHYYEPETDEYHRG